MTESVFEKRLRLMREIKEAAIQLAEVDVGTATRVPSFAERLQELALRKHIAALRDMLRRFPPDPDAEQSVDLTPWSPIPTWDSPPEARATKKKRAKKKARSPILTKRAAFLKAEIDRYGSLNKIHEFSGSDRETFRDPRRRRGSTRSLAKLPQASARPALV